MLLAASIIGGVTLAGCAPGAESEPSGPLASQTGTSTDDAATAVRDRPAVDAATLRNDVAYELEPARSLSALAQESDVVVTGTITGWREGRTIQPSGMLVFTAVLEVGVDRSVPDGAQFADGHVYVETLLGTQALADAGEPFERADDPLLTRLWLDDVEQAAPVGTRVILALTPARTTDQLAAEGEEVVDAGIALPDDAVLYRASSQGFLLENADGSYDSGIADHSYFSGEGWPEPVKDPGGFAALLAELDARS